MVTIDEQRLAEITYLDSGGHMSHHDGVCIMEAVSYITGEEWTDHPQCACPVITSYTIGIHDRMPDDQRQRLLLYMIRIAGSRSTREVEQQRAYLAATWAVKRFAPRALDTYGYTAQAATLRALPDIMDHETARQAANANANAAADAAYAAYAAAADAADADAAYAAAAAAYAAYAAYAAADAAGWSDALACLDALLAVGNQTEQEDSNGK